MAYLFQLFILVCMFASRTIVYANAPDLVYTPVLNYDAERGYNFEVDFDESKSLAWNDHKHLITRDFTNHRKYMFYAHKVNNKVLDK